MNDRVARLRARSLAHRPTLSAERALLVTAFHREHAGSLPPPLLRSGNFHHLCAHKTVWIGDDELIVGERGPEPLAVPTFPELTCHSLDDLRILDSRAKTSYAVPPEVLDAYRDVVIPYWAGRTLREQAFAELDPAWHDAYAAGVFTEFMEQRAPGHTVADGRLYREGLLDMQARIDVALERFADQPARRDQLLAMRESAHAAMLLARRHAAHARALAAACDDTARRAELETIAAVCDRVPAHAPATFHEALQAYWFHHLGVITELNGWDAYNPGHLDRHLAPYYARELAAGTLTRERAKELLGCFFIKFNNHPAPPKVGVTAAESGTYTDFANINLAGLLRDGTSAVNPVSYLLLEVIDELHVLQPSNNVQISACTEDAFVEAAARVIGKGYGYPSVFNADAVVKELVRQGKSVEDAREGGCSGCVETGAFGKEAYWLTGYFNLVKMLELALNDGVDPRTGKRLGPAVGELATFVDVLDAWRAQLNHSVEVKLRGNAVFERLFMATMPAPYLSLLVDDCLENARDYNDGGARYDTSYVQGVGTGTLTDSLSALKYLVFEERRVGLAELRRALADDFADAEPLRRLLLNRPPKWGNDDDRADALMQTCFDAFFDAVDGRPTERGGTYRIDMLPTTCHVHFGTVLGATPDGRRAGTPLSEGISPVQGADRKGPTAVFNSAAKMDHVRTGGTLLNMKFAPDLIRSDAGPALLRQLVRGYFARDGHHVQFNVVTADTLRAAQADPDAHRHLIVRVAGYSDYFCDLGEALQEEIIRRTEHGGS